MGVFYWPIAAEIIASSDKSHCCHLVYPKQERDRRRRKNGHYLLRLGHVRSSCGIAIHIAPNHKSWLNHRIPRTTPKLISITIAPVSCVVLQRVPTCVRVDTGYSARKSQTTAAHLSASISRIDRYFPLFLTLSHSLSLPLLFLGVNWERGK